MDVFPEYSQVEVIELLRAPEHYDGWKVNKRPPAIGDRGVVVDRLSDDDYIVECSPRPLNGKRRNGDERRNGDGVRFHKTDSVPVFPTGAVPAVEC